MIQDFTDFGKQGLGTFGLKNEDMAKNVEDICWHN
jgi:hypothetical protein